MKCDVCHKEKTFLYFIGKSNVCNKCVAKHTVFKEVNESEDALLRKAMRSFDIQSFDELKALTQEQIDLLKEGKIRRKRKKTFKYKKNKTGGVNVGKGTTMSYQEELDTEYP